MIEGESEKSIRITRTPWLKRQPWPGARLPAKWAGLRPAVFWRRVDHLLRRRGLPGTVASSAARSNLARVIFLKIRK